MPDKIVASRVEKNGLYARNDISEGLAGFVTFGS
jgi:hypothetical protein